jgi:hypothetical protein
VHQRHWAGQLHHFYNAGFNLWILADAIGRGFPEADHIHHSQQSQFHWITSPMGLLGCPASFQQLKEGVIRDITYVLVYIDDLRVHTNMHEKHLEVLNKVLAHLHKNHLKINPEKFIFGNKKFLTLVLRLHLK